MGAYSAYCPTRIGILLELLFPINLFVCVAVLFVWLAYNPRYIWVPAAALILSWGGIARYCPIHKLKAPDNSQPGFTLMTYNVYHMLDYEGKETTQNRTLSLLLKQNADLVCLQESPELASPNHGLKISEAQIDSIHAIYPYRIPTSLNMNFLSKYPAELLFDTVYSESSAFAAYRVQIEGHEVTIINQHMESIGLTQTDKELYHEITAHPSTNSLDEVKELLLSKLINAARARNKQADLTAERIEDIPGNVIVCGDMVSRRKPAPDPYLHAAELLGVEPSACVAVEDSPTGIASAHAAGCYAIGYSGCCIEQDISSADEVISTYVGFEL